MSDEAIALRGVPADAFKNTVAEYAPRSLIPACPGDKPKWMTGLISSGCELCLGPMVIEAGRHYADSINLDVFPESHTPRQAAAELAWQQIAMLRPEVKNRRLVVKLNVDPDIRRTTSELLGVGASLSLLDKAGAIDARTIEKMSARFDYEARDRDGNGPVSIEAKGTFESSSTQNHRESFVGKLKALMETGAIRGYSRAIGAIFSTWSTEAPDGVDFELMDPPGTGAGGADEAMRAIIRFYARRFDEVTGLYKAADSLWKLAHYEDLIEPA